MAGDERSGKEGGQRMLSIGEAASELGVSIKTLRKWTDQGIVKAARLPGSRHRRFPPAELVRVRREVLGLENGDQAERAE